MLLPGLRRRGVNAGGVPGLASMKKLVGSKPVHFFCPPTVISQHIAPCLIPSPCHRHASILDCVVGVFALQVFLACVAICLIN